jgi:hypothetical protein
MVAYKEGRHFVLRFRQYPVALAPPAPLAASNLFAVKPDRSVDHLRDPAALQNFFRAALGSVKTASQAKDGIKVWLRLAQEFHQDGFFEFSVPGTAVRVTTRPAGGLEATGKAVVTPEGGNTGEILATLAFDDAGQLVRVSETPKVARGIRPVCQAPKLLDPDPIVRGMAEHAILVMGRRVEHYLAEQRATARPELQLAIDRIWRRILAEDP